MEENIELIERKNWEYSLYKKDEVYELVIPLGSPAPGFDVFHTLTEEETAGYESEGIGSLRGRMADMAKNYLAYKHQSWR